MTTTTATRKLIATQIEDLNARRAALHAELTTCATHMIGTEWHADRVSELEYLTGRVVVLVGRMGE